MNSLLPSRGCRSCHSRTIPQAHNLLKHNHVRRISSGGLEARYIVSTKYCGMTVHHQQDTLLPEFYKPCNSTVSFCMCTHSTGERGDAARLDKAARTRNVKRTRSRHQVGLQKGLFWDNVHLERSVLVHAGLEACCKAVQDLTLYASVFCSSPLRNSFSGW